MKKTNLPEVWSCGGGTQSCAIAVLIIQGKLPKPDVSIMADTGLERSSTWEYFDSVLKPGLARVGVDLIRARKSVVGSRSSQGSFIKDTLLIPAFTNESSRVGKLSNFCTGKWKTGVMDRYLRIFHNIRERRAWIGFSFDEQRRWAKQLFNPNIYMPLVDLRIRREAAIKLVQDFGWPTPPRSNCWMCPNMSDVEWLDLKENSPAEFSQAVQYGKEINTRDPHAWLHKSCKHLDEIEFKPSQDQSRACDSGICFI